MFEKILIVPESGAKKPVIMFIRVDFPAPLGPKRAISSPLWAQRLRLLTAFILPKDLFKFCISKEAFTAESLLQ